MRGGARVEICAGSALISVFAPEFSAEWCRSETGRCYTSVIRGTWAETGADALRQCRAEDAQISRVGGLYTPRQLLWYQTKAGAHPRGGGGGEGPASLGT